MRGKTPDEDKKQLKNDQKGNRKPARDSNGRADAADAGKDRKRSFASLQQEGMKRGMRGTRGR